MSTQIAAPVNRSAQIRKLAAGGLSAEDIREITQFPMKNIRAALKHGDGGKLKSRAGRP